MCRRAGIQGYQELTAGPTERGMAHTTTPVLATTSRQLQARFVPAVGLRALNHSRAALQASADDTSVDLFDFVIVNPDPTSVSHPTRGAPILKRLPKGVRPWGFVTVLHRLIQNVVRDLQPTRITGGDSSSLRQHAFARPQPGGVRAEIRLPSSSVRSWPFDSGASRPRPYP